MIFCIEVRISRGRNRESITDTGTVIPDVLEWPEGNGGILGGNRRELNQPMVAKEKRQEYCQTTGKNTTGGGDARIPEYYSGQ